MIEYTVKVGNTGTKSWHLNNKCHREDGPAIEYASGDKSWYLNGKRHREDGPAIEEANGGKAWYLDGKRHREDGPAMEWDNGNKAWFLDGDECTEKEFNAKMNPVRELSVSEISELLGYEVKVVK